MKPQARTSGQTGQAAPVCEANFYSLPFASQMLVWAMRRRLLAIRDPLRSRRNEDVLQVFHMADWGEVYVALLSFVDICVRNGAVQWTELHAVSCPCLSGVEAHLLNAVAHLQQSIRDEALLSLCEFLQPRAVRLAMPQLETIADEIALQGLGFAYVDLTTLHRAPTQPAPRPDGRMH